MFFAITCAVYGMWVFVAAVSVYKKEYINPWRFLNAVSGCAILAAVMAYKISFGG